MSVVLEEAITEARKLPEAEQDTIAALILAEIADDRRWDESFARSQEALGRLAEKVREDIRAGRVTEMGIDEL